MVLCEQTYVQFRSLTLLFRVRAAGVCPIQAYTVDVVAGTYQRMFQAKLAGLSNDPLVTSADPGLFKLSTYRKQAKDGAIYYFTRSDRTECCWGFRLLKQTNSSCWTDVVRLTCNIAAHFSLFCPNLGKTPACRQPRTTLSNRALEPLNVNK